MNIWIQIIIPKSEAENRKLFLQKRSTLGVWQGFKYACADQLWRGKSSVNVCESWCKIESPSKNISRLKSFTCGNHLDYDSKILPFSTNEELLHLNYTNNIANFTMSPFS